MRFVPPKYSAISSYFDGDLAGDFIGGIWFKNLDICNLGHNILELYNVLIQTRLTTSKRKRDI